MSYFNSINIKVILDILETVSTEMYGLSKSDVSNILNKLGYYDHESTDVWKNYYYNDMKNNDRKKHKFNSIYDKLITKNQIDLLEEKLTLAKEKIMQNLELDKVVKENKQVDCNYFIYGTPKSGKSNLIKQFDSKQFVLHTLIYPTDHIEKIVKFIITPTEEISKIDGDKRNKVFVFTKYKNEELDLYLVSLLKLFNFQIIELK